MLRRLILALLGFVVLAPPLTAQMGGRFGRPMHAGSGFGHGMTFTSRTQPYASRGFFLGDTPYFYADYPFQSFAAEPAVPRESVRESRSDSPQETKSEPLLIELQGDRYVRYSGVQKPGLREITAAPDYAEEPSTKSFIGPVTHSRPPTQAGAGPKGGELPPAVLVYRDGHHEEVADYAIVGAVMYARGDYWRNGYWTKNIQLSALNIPATLKANQDNGTKFSLPAGPNEVVTRP
jgi:hypothetical protein